MSRSLPRPAPPDDLLTIAELSGYTRTADGTEVDHFLRTLAERSPRVHLSSLGTTVEGRDIHLAVIADPPVSSAQGARLDARRRLPVLLIGNIHAGEVCGKEALLMLARDIALADDLPLLEHLIICMLPNYNADGNDRFATNNRPSQIGPEEMGVRHNAQGFDLNRDYVKAETPETRALIRFLNEWDPAVIVDTHTTNGSLHRYTLTYQGPKHPAGDPAVLEFVRDRMLPEVDAAFERATGYHAFFYGNFSDDHTEWVTYPAEPRYGVVYRGLRSRLSILSEAYAYAPFRDRVLATYAFCDTVLVYSACHPDRIRSLIDAADDHAVLAGRTSATLPLRNEPVPLPGKVTVFGYGTGPGADRETRMPRNYRVDFINLFVPTLSTTRPRAYAIPASLSRIVDHLRLHGIRVDRLDAAIESVAAEIYTIESFARSEQPFQGHHVISDVSANPEAAVITLPAGTLIVPVDQPLGTLAAYLLEPQASDGLVAWNFLDQHLAPGARYPIIRVLDPLPLD